MGGELNRQGVRRGEENFFVKRRGERLERSS